MGVTQFFEHYLDYHNCSLFFSEVLIPNSGYNIKTQLASHA
ncbi:Uncharacterised protein [Suttonella indologenes]|uniref:Uncharacterized protein n=1 Tax=Suttonella indologenes TaxID=13276 RepID=A0A380MXM4_9GAMM|nr:Uncharacterised protein [Suttonella indologenes]